MSIGPYWLGDSPATPIELELISDEDLAGYSSATVRLLSPAGELAAAIDAGAISADATITFTLPPDTFTIAGVWTLAPRITGTAGTVSLPQVRLVVQQDDGWLSLEATREQWASAPEEDDQLQQLLETARIQCSDYAPALVGRPPANYRQAQLAQARAIWQSARANVGDQFGGDGYQVTVYPMDWTVKNLLRPKRPLGFVK